jgi:transposase InsO family protein
MVHLDVKKVGRIPDGGGWRIHGRDSDQARVASRAKSAGAKRGYVYLHSVVDGFSRLAYTEPLGDEKGATAAAFLARAKVWFAAHGINHIHRVVTDNGACYRSGDFARIVGQGTRHQRTKPYTPRHNGKVERYRALIQLAVGSCISCVGRLSGRCCRLCFFAAHAGEGVAGVIRAGRGPAAVRPFRPSQCQHWLGRAGDRVSASAGGGAGLVTIAVEWRGHVQALGEMNREQWPTYQRGLGDPPMGVDQEGAPVGTTSAIYLHALQ